MADAPDVRKDALRRQVLDSRAALHPGEKRRADRQMASHLLRLLQERDCVDLAGFHPFRGEPDLRPALEVLAEAGRRIWLPVVDGRGLRFRRWTPDTPMQPNRFGIPEPVEGPFREPERLDIVLTPLVAYSASGMRLGMGAGFYDRAFAFLRAHPEAGPWLVGAAYTLQQLDSLPADPWDVPLAAVLTERGLQVFRE
ncbi:5-formyltetrahydrofolate cyclo-ligase [Wenzhouxiangella sp. XN79A]|uniref:5-formyltetrahydrofolate cyclo-ligase n=1 Tax=Wenzhouxiangella sp. XN79A TaxID=2724193 RepID=UPI00144AEE05|nr:5-formyltetrahydrofolate cyclo-ligase [Wenzhouxiangella sp. XN79A]NKI36061.1 5-formyltetrahydrofolate cyclo-ligase [Wenzhouxiangella sp. XN79A]